MSFGSVLPKVAHKCHDAARTFGECRIASRLDIDGSDLLDQSSAEHSLAFFC